METKEKQESLVIPNVICYVCSFREQPIVVITYPVTEIWTRTPAIHTRSMLELNSTVQNSPSAQLLLLSELLLV